MSIAHAATFASDAVPIPLEVHDSERLAYIGERLAVLAVAARVLARRHPEDVYARSIERETGLLAYAMRDALAVDVAPTLAHIVDAPPVHTPHVASTSSATAYATASTSPALDVSSAPHDVAPDGGAPPEAPDARQGATVFHSTQRSPATLAASSGASSEGFTPAPRSITRGSSRGGKGRDHV